MLIDMESEFNYWSTEAIYEYLCEIGIIDPDIEPYKFWRYQREDMLFFLRDVEQIWTR